MRFADRLSIAALAGAALLGPIPMAHADQPNCTSADLEGVRAGVDASTSAYLFTHPDLNHYVGTLQGLTREQVAAHMQDYLAQHPQEQAEMSGIRQPLADLKNRCGVDIPPS